MGARITYWAVRLGLELICVYLVAVGLALAMGEGPSGGLFFALALPSALVLWAERWKRWLGCLPLCLTLLGYLFLLLMAGAFYFPVNALHYLYPLLLLGAFLLGRSMHRTA